MAEHVSLEVAGLWLLVAQRRLEAGDDPVKHAAVDEMLREVKRTGKLLPERK